MKPNYSPFRDRERRGSGQERGSGGWERRMSRAIVDERVWLSGPLIRRVRAAPDIVRNVATGHCE